MIRQYVTAYPAEERTVGDLYELGSRARNRQLTFSTAMLYTVPRV